MDPASALRILGVGFVAESLTGGPFRFGLDGFKGPFNPLRRNFLVGQKLLLLVLGHLAHIDNGLRSLDRQIESLALLDVYGRDTY